MKKIVFSLVALLVSSIAMSQSVSWGFFLEGNGNRANKTATDINGNVFVIGDTGGDDQDFDPSPAVTLAGYDASSNPQSYLAKYDALGAFQWVVILGPEYLYHTTAKLSLDTDDNGNVYVAGSYRGTFDFDPGTGTTSLSTNGLSDYDAFVQKFDANGNFLQVRTIPGTGNTLLRDFTYKGGKIYFVCDVTGSNIWDGGVTPETSPRGCIGTWTTSLANVAYDRFGANTMGCISIAVDDQLNKYVTGYFTGQIDAPGPVGVYATGEDIFVVKYSAAAAAFSLPDWAAPIGSSGNDRPKDIAVDGNQNVVLVFDYVSTDPIDVDPGSGVVNHSIAAGAAMMAVIVKLSGTGAYVWSNELKSSFSGYYVGISEVHIDADNNIYNFGIGDQNGAVDFDFGSGTATQTAGATNAQHWFQKIDENAAYQWAFFVDNGTSSTIGNNGDFYLTGFTYEELANFGTPTAPFILDASTNTSFSTLLVKYEQCIISNAVTLSGGILTATQATGPYQWYDCDSNDPVPGATSQSFTPTYTSDYSVVVGSGSCTATSDCIVVTVGTNAVDENLLSNIQIHPNPTNGLVTISNIPVGALITISDASGRIIATQTSDINTTIDLSNQENGVYFVSIIESGTSTTKKLIINK